jgi:hypothetical protein
LAGKSARLPVAFPPTLQRSRRKSRHFEKRRPRTSRPTPRPYSRPLPEISAPKRCTARRSVFAWKCPFPLDPRSRDTSKHSLALVDWLRVTENLAASIAAVVGQEARPLIHLGPTGHEKSRRLCRQSERSIQRTALPFLGMRDRIRLLPSATSGRGRHRQGECLPDGPTPSTAPMCDHEAALAV